jgi:hypothetical protein
MDLANMRSLGLRSITVGWDCGRRASVDLSQLSDAIAVPALCWRLRFSNCGAGLSTCGPTGGSIERMAPPEDALQEGIVDSREQGRHRRRRSGSKLSPSNMREPRRRSRRSPWR